jgi:ribosomal protein S18 acetylase RimI-like enzyme
MILLSQHLTDKGFSVADVEESDFPAYYAVKKACYKKYVDEYYGGWVDDVQKELQIREFNNSLSTSSFIKISLNNEIVGFFAYNELDGEISGITIQMTKEAQGNGVGSFYLEHITSMSNKNRKPIFLKVFKSNPAKNLYERFGFETYDETATHYLMSYTP